MSAKATNWESLWREDKVLIHWQEPANDLILFLKGGVDEGIYRRPSI
jgi:hypothetical protein